MNIGTQIQRRNSNKIHRLSATDNIYYIIVYTILIFLLIIVLYPLVYILSASFSSPNEVLYGKVWLYPVNFSTAGYKAVLRHKDIFIGYRNTIFYTFIGTAINVFMTATAAYALSRKTLPGRRFFTFLFTFTMIFSGGLIPSYILMRDLHIINTVWVMLLPGAIGITNLIITRTFMQTNIPLELLEASKMDGCSDFRYFSAIVLPLSKAVVAVITLYYSVGHWNSYFNAFIYLNKKELYPLQLFLRDILIMNQSNADVVVDPSAADTALGLQELLKYALIVVASAPILCMYPFVQRYFEKGVMIGSLKG